MADFYLDAGALFERARDVATASVANPAQGYALTDVVETEDAAEVVFSNTLSAQTFVQGTFCGAVAALKQRGVAANQVEQTPLGVQPGMHVRLHEFEAARANLAAALRAGGSEDDASNVIMTWLADQLPFPDGRTATAAPLAIVVVAAAA